MQKVTPEEIEKWKEAYEQQETTNQLYREICAAVNKAVDAGITFNQLIGVLSRITGKAYELDSD